MPPPFPDSVRLAQAFKEYFLDFFEGSTFGPPFLLIERGGMITHIILTRAVGPPDVMPIVRMLYALVPHDALVLVVEASTRLGTRFQGATLDEALEVARREHPPGRLQELIEQGKAGEFGIVDTLMAIRIAAADKSQSLYMLPYFYSGKDTPFSWFTSQFKQLGAGPVGERVGGDVPEMLAHAYSGPKAADLVERFKATGFADLTPEERADIGARSQEEIADLLTSFSQLPADRLEQLQTTLTLEHLENQGCAIFTNFASFRTPQP